MRLIIVILLMIGAVLLEMYLSRRPSRWPGLVLPGISFLFALLYPLNMAALDGVTASFIAQLVMVWLLANVPTFVLLAIYFTGRRRQPRSKAEQKMHAQDL